MNHLVANSHQYLINRQSGAPIRRFDRQMRATNACLAAVALATPPGVLAELIALWMTGEKKNVQKLARHIKRIARKHWAKFDPQLFLPSVPQSLNPKLNSVGVPIITKCAVHSKLRSDEKGYRRACDEPAARVGSASL